MRFCSKVRSVRTCQWPRTSRAVAVSALGVLALITLHTNTLLEIFQYTTDHSRVNDVLVKIASKLNRPLFQLSLAHGCILLDNAKTVTFMRLGITDTESDNGSNRVICVL